ncbi:phytanoyl-CoA dioxygenase family protein [Paenibacillus psychroresistens]|uniref:Phytanoyl-CoA dioxygenase family protein n=1 Tax=Paenibacillus psychroresistens TaxID=1778678 RepID=A0A6B8RSY1_9BACL|nr:phytanoyl-CoA dioxygenase family protein [Paenibacillus psychroresistens]QGQ98426.1 phytanoyl-CoA dioxygenase family protein [Paenibacillus psychroresistens]
MSKLELTAEQINNQLYRYDKVHVSLNSKNELQAEHLQNYRRDGFLSIDSLLEQPIVDSAIEGVMELGFVDRKGAKLQFIKSEKELKTLEEKELALRKISEFVEEDERLKAVAYHPEILNVIRQIFGEEPKLIQDMALLKPPHGGGEKPWHQDMAYGNLTYTKAVIGVWIALDEADVNNGCMHVIPRSHQEGATPHYAIRDWQLCDIQVPVERDVIVPLKPGGVLFFHGMLYHGTPSNFSNKQRRALQFHYAPASSERVGPHEYKRMFTNELSGAEC